MNIFRKPILNQTGDTIIEVLIVLAILSSTLGLAFATTNRANKSIQANKERHQAQLIANSQADLLRSTDIDLPGSGNIRNALNSPSTLPATQCFYINGTSILYMNDEPDTGSNCHGIEGLYTVNITCVPVAPANPLQNCSDNNDTFNLYKISVTWDSLKGGQDNVELTYGN
jgi:type II secretory pathway pseudopilin PulG